MMGDHERVKMSADARLMMRWEKARVDCEVVLNRVALLVNKLPRKQPLPSTAEEQVLIKIAEAKMWLKQLPNPYTRSNPQTDEEGRSEEPEAEDALQ